MVGGSSYIDRSESSSKSKESKIMKQIRERNSSALFSYF